MWRRAMPLGRTPRSWQSIRSLADLRARRVARLECACARPTRARTSSDLTAGTDTPQRRGELGVAHPAQLAHQQRRALLLGQAAGRRRSAGAATRAARPRRSGRRSAPPQRARAPRGRERRGAPQLVDAAVVGDPVQPRPQRQLAVARAQARRTRCTKMSCRASSASWREAGEHLARIGEQPLPVAVVDDPEGLVVPGPEQRDELLVGPQPEQRRPDRRSASRQAGRCLEGRGFHVNPCDSL